MSIYCFCKIHVVISILGDPLIDNRKWAHILVVIGLILTKLQRKVSGTLFPRCKLSRWHLPWQHLSWRHLSISEISQLLLARFLPNFKSRFLGPSLTDVNCHGDIFQGKICPDNICPHHKYFSCYWPDYDKTYLTQFFGTIIFDQFFWSKNLVDPKLFWTKIYLILNFFGH